MEWVFIKRRSSWFKWRKKKLFSDSFVHYCRSSDVWMHPHWQSCWMLLSLRNPSPALGVELNTLLLQGVQTMDRYPRPLLPQSPSRPYHPTSHPSFIPSFKACHPPVLIWACHFTSRVSRSLISVGVCLFEPLFAFLWSSLLLLQKTMLVFLYSEFSYFALS